MQEPGVRMPADLIGLDRPPAPHFLLRNTVVCDVPRCAACPSTPSVCTQCNAPYGLQPDGQCRLRE